MADIVILGAGIGGMPMAYEMRERLRPEDRLNVISNSPNFQFVPSNPWLAVNWRKRPEVEFAIGPYRERKGIDFIPVGARRIHATENEVELEDGRRIQRPYDGGRTWQGAGHGSRR